MDHQLPDGTLWRHQFESSDLVRLAAGRFTSLAPIVAEDEGSIHLQISALGREFANRLNEGDERGATEVLRFLDAALASGKPTSQIENPLQISFGDMDDLMQYTAAGSAFRDASEALRELLSVRISPEVHNL